jgi:hypothetical protein
VEVQSEGKIDIRNSSEDILQDRVTEVSGIAEGDLRGGEGLKQSS